MLVISSESDSPMTRDEIVHLIEDLHQREVEKMGRYLGNMDSRGQISSTGNYHNGVAMGLRLALNLVKTIDAPAKLGPAPALSIPNGERQ